MKTKIFVDTNILLYSLDKFDKEKQKLSRLLLREIALEKAVVISTQVLQEFYVAAIKKLNATPSLVKEIIISFEKFEVVQTSTEMIKDAIDTSILNKISFWDSLIVVSAESAGCKILLTEDLNHGQFIRGIKIVNPFLE